MGRKSKYSADFKLIIIHEAETSGITKTSRKYSLSDHTIRTWKLIYRTMILKDLRTEMIIQRKACFNLRKSKELLQGLSLEGCSLKAL